jgi:predicted aspartyl protease
MGITYIDGEVKCAGSQKARVRFPVDSGASYTLLPETFLKTLKLKRMRTMAFTPTAGTQIERNISECHVALSHCDGYTPVILGHAGDGPLLGVVTLESLELIQNPFYRTLQPKKMMLATAV